MNFIRTISVLFVAVFLSSLLQGQKKDPVLFTVADTPVHLSEFQYIYAKNSGNKTDYSEESLREYLNLYTKFKLKVQRAKDLKMDTIPVLQKELAGYRKQLAKTYLTDKQVTNRLIQEVYDRSQKDVGISHILLNLPMNATDEEFRKVSTKANKIIEEIQGGLSFEDAVKQYSQDKISKENKGFLGYFTSMFPSGFYELENAAYGLEVGGVSAPVRTRLGVHIVKLNDIRDARGEVEIAHILIRKKSQRRTRSNAKTSIDSIYQKLNEGADFKTLANKYSEDKATSNNGGYIGFFGINRFETSFEDAAFSLRNDDTYCAPIETSVGWHIIQRISKKKRDSFEDAQKRIKTLLRKDSRQKKAKESMIQRIQEESKFKENAGSLDVFTKSLNKDFYSYKWEPSNARDVLFTMDDKAFTYADFGKYLKANTRNRMRMSDAGIATGVKRMYADFVEDQVMAYEESQLEKKYPEFKSIMREYEEGILLFEVTKAKVWDKASKDSVGLKQFYEANKHNYTWKERANVKDYELKSVDPKLVGKFMKKAKCKSPEYLKKKFGDIFTYSDHKYERGSKEVAGIKFKKNSISIPDTSKRGITKFRVIKSVMPSALKKLSEARGYIEADYQDQLEKEWVRSLRKMYPVKINDAVFKSLIK